MIKFPRKEIRADLIAHHVRLAGYKGAVCFSCGNASAALVKTGIYVVDVSPTGALEAKRWWQPWEVARAWPELFDATSGHLPLWLMVKIADAFKEHIGELKPGATHQVGTGSGESFVCLQIAYPEVHFEPVYGLTRGTQYDKFAPLNPVVNALRRR